jgi:hypothetical protein
VLLAGLALGNVVRQTTSDICPCATTPIAVAAFARAQSMMTPSRCTRHRSGAGYRHPPQRFDSKITEIVLAVRAPAALAADRARTALALIPATGGRYIRRQGQLRGKQHR